jgi:hypothetical protein
VLQVCGPVANPNTLAYKAEMDELSHHQTFHDLMTLVGPWHGVTGTGRALAVTYTSHAKGSVLMEHWQLSERVDALTLYHMDKKVLMATHYCPLCNQPRLELTHRTGNEFGFEFVSATNMSHMSDGHQHSFQVRLNDDGTFWRSETYVGKGAFSEAVTYRRLPAQLPKRSITEE